MKHEKGKIKNRNTQSPFPVSLARCLLPSRRLTVSLLCRAPFPVRFPWRRPDWTSDRPAGLEVAAGGQGSRCSDPGCKISPYQEWDSTFRIILPLPAEPPRAGPRICRVEEWSRGFLPRCRGTGALAQPAWMPWIPGPTRASFPLLGWHEAGAHTQVQSPVQGEPALGTGPVHRQDGLLLASHLQRPRPQGRRRTQGERRREARLGEEQNREGVRWNGGSGDPPA